MSKFQVCITFTEKEFAFLNKRAESKKKTLWTMLQSDINKSFGGLIVPDDKVCDGNKERVVKTIDIPQGIWPALLCVSKSLGISPGQLVYRVIVAPHLGEIIKEGSLVAEVGGSD